MNPPSPSASLLAFCERVIADPELFEQLAGQPDAAAFAAKAVAIGAGEGLVFSEDEVRELLRQAGRAWLERAVS